jgi:hypothetical protein
MNQNTFCNKCHRIPSQCRCSLVKKLTDEEIHDLIINKTTDSDMIKQALRKAQEK